MKKIAFFELEDWEIKYFSKMFSSREDVELSFSEEKLTEENASKFSDTEIISSFIYSQVNKKILDLLPKLKMIATRSTGYDHIDLLECKKRGVLVTNVPTYGENTVAEHTFALILTLSRKIRECLDKVKNNDFSLDDLQGFDLRGKTLGIIGVGNIGVHVARIAFGFEMKILAVDLFPKKEVEEKYGVQYVSLEELLKKSDIISLHLPLLDSTRHLINQENIGLIKKGAYIINTARGGLIETEALWKAIQSGNIAGAGLDVLESERIIKEEKELLSYESLKKRDLSIALYDHILIEDPRVVVTPHNAFNSKEAIERIMETTGENIKSYLDGFPLRNRVQSMNN